MPLLILHCRPLPLCINVYIFNEFTYNLNYAYCQNDITNISLAIIIQLITLNTPSQLLPNILDIFVISIAMNMKKKILTISIDGLIGAGKTTLLKQLQNKHVLVITEPVDDWKYLLSQVSKNPQKYIISLQKEILKHYTSLKKLIDNYTNDNITKLIIIERSSESSILIFAKAYVNMGFLSKSDFNDLQKVAINSSINFDFRVMIDTNINNCIERIKQRGRKCESQLAPDYLSRLNELQNKFYKSLNPQQTFTINGNQTKQKVLQDFKDLFAKF